MKNILPGIVLSLFILNMSNAATVQGRVVIDTNNGTTYVIRLQVNTDTGTDDMGGATIIFNFNNADLSFPDAPVPGSDYTFHNFSGGNYSAATVTKPSPNQIWLNIELNVDNAGTLVAQNPSWTDIASITFSTTDPGGNSALQWQTLNSNFSIFDGDNTNKWTVGTFTDQNTTPLPVELTSFAASAEKNSVSLKWQTETEINNYGFEIERAVNDGKALKPQYRKIGFVNGSGNSNNSKYYSFIDKNPTGGSKYLYRLKQIDSNGSFEYTDAVEVDLLPDKFELSQNYPNPFNPSTEIKFSLPGNSRVRLDVFNIIGEQVAALLDQEMEAGYHIIKFDASGLAGGTYIYRLQTNDQAVVKKMILLK